MVDRAPAPTNTEAGASWDIPRDQWGELRPCEEGRQRVEAQLCHLIAVLFGQVAASGNLMFQQ